MTPFSNDKRDFSKDYDSIIWLTYFETISRNVYGCSGTTSTPLNPPLDSSIVDPLCMILRSLLEPVFTRLHGKEHMLRLLRSKSATD